MYVVLNNKLKFNVKQQHEILSISNLARTKEKIKAVVDSGASDHYWPVTYKGEAHSTKCTPTPVGTANGATIRSVATNRFPMEGVPAGARTCKKFVEISFPLVSVGKFCQHGLTVVFAGTKVIVLDKNGKRIHMKDDGTPPGICI